MRHSDYASLDTVNILPVRGHAQAVRRYQSAQHFHHAAPERCLWWPVGIRAPGCRARTAPSLPAGDQSEWGPTTSISRRHISIIISVE